MNVYIPLAIGQQIPGEVLDSLAGQTIPVNIITVGTLGMVNSSRVPGRSIHIARTREVIAKLARIDGTISAMCDSDIVHLKRDNLALAVEYLKKYPVCGAVALRPPRSRTHWLIQCVVMSPAAWKQANFGDGKECNCWALKKALMPYFDVEYLDDNIRIQEIPRPQETDIATDALKAKIWDLDHFPHAWDEEKKRMTDALGGAIQTLESGKINDR